MQGVDMKYAPVKCSLMLVLCILSFSDLRAQWVENTPDGGLTCFAVSGTNLFVGGGGVFLSTNGGANWSKTDSGLTAMGIHACAASDSNLLAGTTFNGVLRSTNNGKSWTDVNTGLPQHTGVYAFAVSGRDLFAGTDGTGVFLSTDNGTNWNAVGSGLTEPVFALAVCDTNILAGNGFGVFLSSKNGTRWTAADSGLTNPFVNVLAVSDTNIFAGTDSGVFVSTSMGKSWSALSTGLPQYSMVTALATSGTNLFAGIYEKGVFLSTNNGMTWSEVNTGLSGLIGYQMPFVYALAVSGTNLFAVINGVVWQRPLSEMITSVQPISEDRPARFGLDQNYPNPFNPTTNIQFSIVHHQLTIVKVYDVLGRVVATLVNEVKEPGTYTVEFHASSLASGVYFYRLTAGQYVECRKMIVMK